MIAILAGCMKLIYVEIQNNNNSATNSNTTAQYVTQCCNCFGSTEQLFANQWMIHTRVRRCTLHFNALVYFIFWLHSKTNVEWFHPNDRFSFAHLFATWKVNKCRKLRIKTDTKRSTPLSVLIADFVYIPHFSCASSFSMSNNILSLDCALFFALLSFGLAMCILQRVRCLFFVVVCVHYSPNYIHGACIINELTEH